MTPKHKRMRLAWGYGLTALLLLLTVLAGFSAGTAQGRQGTATPTPPPTDDPAARAQQLLAEAYGVLENLDNVDVQAALLLGMRSLQTRYSVDADRLVTELIDRLMTIEMIYANPRYAYDMLNDLAVSPDGRLVATAQDDGSLFIYEVQTGALVHTPPNPIGEVYALAFAPDSQTLAGAGFNGEWATWDTATGATRLNARAGRGTLQDVAYHPTGALLAVVGDLGELRVYDSATGTLVRQFDHDRELNHVAFSPDGQTLLFTDSADWVYWWEVASGEFRQAVLTEANYLADAIFSADGQHAILSTASNQLLDFDLVSGEIVKRVILPAPVGTLALSPDGRSLLVGAMYAPRAFRLDSTSWELLNSYTGDGHGTWGVAFAPDGASVFVGFDDAYLHRFPTKPGHAPGRFTDHRAGIAGVAYSPNGSLLLSADESGFVQFRDTATQAVVHQWQLNVGDDASYTGIFSAGFVTDTVIWTANYDYAIRLWDVASGDLRLEMPAAEGAAGYGVPAVAISPDGTVGAFTYRANHIYLHDLASGELIRMMRQNNGGAILPVFAPDGTRLAVVGTDRRVRIYDVASGRVLRVLGEYRDELASLAFTPDGTQVVIGSVGRVQIVEVATSTVLRTFQFDTTDYSLPTTVAFTADTRRVMALNNEGIVQVWDVPSANVVRSLVSFNGDTARAAFDPTETLIAVGSYGGAVQWWSLNLVDTVALGCSLLTHDLSAEQMAEHEIDNDVPPCPNLGPAAGAIQPTWTPYPTDALPVWTPLPTLPPTNTPTATPTPRQFIAQVGENRGTLEIGEVQQWTYRGRPGDVIQIELRADRPANDRPDAERERDNLLDAYLRVYTTYGLLITENDDLTPGVQTDSLVTNLTPPYPGTVMIEVSSFEGRTGGGYTLVITVLYGNRENPHPPTPAPLRSEGE